MFGDLFVVTADDSKSNVVKPDIVELPNDLKPNINNAQSEMHVVATRKQCHRK
jgi:hypothetical protein